MENHQHEHVHEIKSLDSIFIISIVLNLLFVAIEALVGFTQNSLGLLSDAGHNLGDVFSLLLALVAFKLARVRSSEKYTYGYKKSTVLISLLNAIILLVAVGAIVVESIHKFTHPEAVNGAAVSWTAGAGIVVNGLTAWLLMKSQKKDLNVKGAFLHMAADTLVSVGVVISGLVMMFTGFYLIDPIISIVIAAVILVSTWKLLSQSVRLSLDGIPESVDMDGVRQAIVSDADVAGMHHIHVWAISTTEIALTAHIVLRPGADMEAVKERVKSRLSRLGIAHATLEVEFEGTPCHDMHCDCCGGNG
ncbi:MAG: cation transporter [Muribaculum sp.]|uniref:Cation transporter n=1 Tax=Candidatus Merdivivens faecigallinarum TaxID=2840871 RepID=A0A9D9NQ11_9BACT|nr:cation transporter [Candidatus Merdivivens faecigallinarum]